jgi:hypothetical protein
LVLSGNLLWFQTRTFKVQETLKVDRKPRFSFQLSNEIKMSKVDKQRWADDEEEEEVQVLPLCS